MIAALGIFGSFFFYFLIGSFLPIKRSFSLSEVLFRNFAYSLFISWGLVSIFHFTFFEYNITPIIVIWGVINFYFFRKNTSTINISKGEIYGLIGLTFSILYLILILQSKAAYTSIFSFGDDVASWNSWAVELTENNYTPYNTAYPILLPGLWSLIYRFQGSNEIWVFAKASLIFQPIIISIGLSYLFVLGKKVSALLLGIVTFYFFIVLHHKYMMLGYMDIPVAVMILVAGISICTVIVSVNKKEESSIINNRLVVSAILCGLAAITKQPGVIMIFVFVVLLVVLRAHRVIFINKNKRVLLCLFAPLGAYLLMYYSFEKNIFGNLEVLEGLVNKRAKEENLILHGYSQILKASNKYYLWALFVIGLSNLLNYRRLNGQMGLAFLMFAFLGFVLFSDCCAYHYRNSLWIYSLLMCSAIFAFFRIDRVVLPSINE